MYRRPAQYLPNNTLACNSNQIHANPSEEQIYYTVNYRTWEYIPVSEKVEQRWRMICPGKQGTETSTRIVQKLGII